MFYFTKFFFCHFGLDDLCSLLWQSGVFDVRGWWRFTCCLSSKRNRQGCSHRSLGWHHKKKTHNKVPWGRQGGGGKWTVGVGVVVGGLWGFGFGLHCHWLKTERGTHLWVPEAKDIGCHLKITPVGENGRRRQRRGVRVHVNQALYKFSLCLLEELNWLTPPPRADGKKQVLPRQQEDSWRHRKLVSSVPGFVYGCTHLKGTAFPLLPATPEVDCPSAGAGRRKSGQLGVESPHTMMPLVLGLRPRNCTWEKTG